MTTQNQSGLLDMFRRFADLSCYWHRAHTPDDLAMSELQERLRLSVDIPEQIRRLMAFAELGLKETSKEALPEEDQSA